MKILDAHIEAFHREGFAVVENFLDASSLQRAQDALWDVFPRPEAYFQNPDQYRQLGRSQFAGLKLFPYPSWDINRLAVYPDLVDAAQRICGTDELHLYKIELWGKYAGAIDYEQVHHYDYGNHSLVVPKRAAPHIQLTCFILLSDVTEADGPTRIVPRKASVGTPLVPREQPAGAFKDEEVALTGPAGSLVIYQTSVLHRGTDFGEPGRSRFIMLVDFQPRGWAWTGKMAWPSHALNPAWTEAMVKMTPYERTLFGFPAVGDPYWDAQTTRDTGLRYPGMDMRPYEQST
ncbi:MAG: phytanoyl-CoA dioxygenase family protein [bacterium]